MSEALRVLAFSDDAELLRVAKAAVEAGDALAVTASRIEVFVEQITRAPVAMVLLDVRTEGALSLVHHVRSLAPNAAVVVAVDPDAGPALRAALDLGADALVTTPLHGDAVMRALARARLERGALTRITALEADVERAHATTREIRRLVDAAVEGDDELVAAALDALAEIAPNVSARVWRDASPFEPKTAVSGDTQRLPLGEEGREAGVLELAGGDSPSRALALDLASVLSSLLALRARLVGSSAHGIGPARTLDRRIFDDVLTRELEKARRHGRALALLAIDAEGVDLAALTTHLRVSDVVTRSDREVLVLLPETSAVGAVRLQRRIGARPSGIAACPRDGATRDALLETACAARERMRASPLLALTASPTSGLVELVERLLALPLQDAGALTSYPLLLGVGAACSLVKHACLEAARQGEAFVHVTAGPIAAAVREAAAERDASMIVLEHAAPSPVFAVAITSEFGSWACAGRFDDGAEAVSALHGADPLLADWIAATVEGT